jgi:hypothetical protein
VSFLKPKHALKCLLQHLHEECLSFQ